VEVTINDQPASWAGVGGAAPSTTFTDATIAQPATGARNATMYQPLSSPDHGYGEDRRQEGAEASSGAGNNPSA
jgi:hypothetical protein